jgi:hypothetical protein
MKRKKDTKEKVCISARVLWDNRCSFKFWGADLALLLKILFLAYFLNSRVEAPAHVS